MTQGGAGPAARVLARTVPRNQCGSGDTAPAGSSTGCLPTAGMPQAVLSIMLAPLKVGRYALRR
jgi:hypothetical protein